MRFRLELAASAVLLALAASIFFAWRAQHRDNLLLQSQLHDAQESLNAASARQESREASLSALLAQLKKQKAAVQKPADVVKVLPEVLPLPQPITLAGGGGIPPSLNAGAGLPPSQPKNPSTQQAASAEPAAKPNLPAADLKPLYDFAIDCKACQAELAAAQANLKDEQQKEAALGKERDAALRAAKGGSVLRRVVRAAKWFALGAAAGAIAAKAR